MENVRAVERALELLECFSDTRKEIGLSELSRILMLPKATVLRLARTLANKGYLIQEPERQTYRLGPMVLSLGQAFLTGLDYLEVALPFMEALRDKIKETVSIYAMAGEERMCVQRVESSHALRNVVNVGDRLPINRGAAGKILIAFQKLDPNGLDPDEIQRIQRQGYAVSFDERKQGLAAIAAPIYNNKGQVIAALSVSGPIIRFGRDSINRNLEKIVQTAKEISWHLGYRG